MSSVSAPRMASLCLLPGVDPGCMGGSMDKHDLGLSVPQSRMHTHRYRNHVNEQEMVVLL